MIFKVCLVVIHVKAKSDYIVSQKKKKNFFFFFFNGPPIRFFFWQKKNFFFFKAPKTTKYDPSKKYYENSNSMKKSSTFESLAENKDIKQNEQNDTSFFDILSRIQSNRLDDQRCSFRLVSNEKSKKKKIQPLIPYHLSLKIKFRKWNHQ
jgi:hypothetical protein